MIPTQQAVIHQLIPEYEQALNQDFPDELDEKYEKYHLLANFPSLDQLLERTPEGQYLLTLKRQREILKDRTISAENQADRIYQPTDDGLSRVLSIPPVLAPSPWSEVPPGVSARMTIQEGFSGRNRLEFRILPSITESAVTRVTSGGASFRFAASAVAVPAESAADILGICVAETPVGCAATAVIVVGVVLFAYPISRPAQPLTLAPILQNSSGAGTGATPSTNSNSRTRTRTHTDICDDQKLKDILKQKNTFCKTLPFSCSGEKKCSIINRNIGQAFSCLALKTFIQTECYAPGDPEYDGHQENVDNTQRTLDKCVTALKTCVA